MSWLIVFSADEPFKEYDEFEIDIRMIRAVAVDVGSTRKALPGVDKTFFFIGDGTASEVVARPTRTNFWPWCILKGEVF